MTYKGYTARVEVDPDAGVIHGQVINLKDVITFSAVNVKELKQAFHDSVDDYLEFCENLGQEPEKPFSGRVLLRLDPELHRDVAVAAAREDQSLNSWLVSAAKRALV